MTDQLTEEIALLERHLADVLASLDKMRRQIALRLDAVPVGDIEAWRARWGLAAQAFGVRHRLTIRQRNTISRLGRNACYGYRIETEGWKSGYNWWDNKCLEDWIQLPKRQGRPPEFAEWVRNIADGTIDPQDFYDVGQVSAAVIKRACIAEQEITP